MSRAGAAFTRGRLALCALVMALAVAGCGGEESTSPVSAAPATGDGGTLSWALAQRPSQLDPLLATSRADQLVTRQVHEPLVETLTGPFGDTRRRPGLALSSRPSSGNTIWSFRVRPGVRFQDGTPLNAGAVMVNGRRWLTTPQGRALMPNLFAVDAPRPDLVRFLLERPDPRFPESLALPRTGIVSPRALTDPSGESAELRRRRRSGTGAFEFRERSGGELLIARNPAWWGTKHDLGPALDLVRFPFVADADARLALLAAGDVQAADRLGTDQARTVRRDPLLELLPGRGSGSLGLERSVRGIASAREVPSLSGVWVTRLGGG